LSPTNKYESGALSALFAIGQGRVSSRLYCRQTEEWWGLTGRCAFTADVGFVGEVPDPLRVSPSPCRHARLLNSFRAVDTVLLALHGDERPPAAGALARSEPVTDLRKHVHRIDDDGPWVSTRRLSGPWRPLARESNTCLP